MTTEMVHVNLKKESKKARKKQRSFKKHFPTFIDMTKEQIRLWNKILEIIQNIEKELDVINEESDPSDDSSECFEKKASAVNNIKRLFNEYLDTVELEFAEKDKWVKQHIVFLNAFVEVLKFDMINAIDKNLAKSFTLHKSVNDDFTEEEINSLKEKSLKEGATWVNDL